MQQFKGGKRVQEENLQKQGGDERSTILSSLSSQKLSHTAKKQLIKIKH